MQHHRDKIPAMKNGYTARNNHHVIVKNLSQFMLWSCFLMTMKKASHAYKQQIKITLVTLASFD